MSSCITVKYCFFVTIDGHIYFFSFNFDNFSPIIKDVTRLQLLVTYYCIFVIITIASNSKVQIWKLKVDIIIIEKVKIPKLI